MQFTTSFLGDRFITAMRLNMPTFHNTPLQKGITPVWVAIKAYDQLTPWICIGSFATMEDTAVDYQSNLGGVCCAAIPDKKDAISRKGITDLLCEEDMERYRRLLWLDENSTLVYYAEIGGTPYWSEYDPRIVVNRAQCPVPDVIMCAFNTCATQ